MATSGASFLRSAGLEVERASALAQMEYADRKRRIFNFPKDGIEQQSDIDVDYWTQDLPEPSKSKALLHAAFGLMRKDVMGSWSKSISSDIADSEKDVFQEFMRSRIDDPSGHRSEREAMQEHYITKMLGFNSTRPSAHQVTRYTQTGPGKDGRIQKRDVTSRGGENQYGEWYDTTPEFSAASKLEGEDSLVQRRMVSEYMERPEYFEDLWKSALKTNSFEEIATGTSGINSIAGRELRKMLDSLNAIPQDPRSGSMDWGNHVDDMMLMRNAIMDARPGGSRVADDVGIDTGDSSQETPETLDAIERAARGDVGLTTTQPTAAPAMTNAQRTVQNRDAGYGAIPAAYDAFTRAGIYGLDWAGDMAMQPIRTLTRSVREGSAKMRTQEWKDRQPSFGSSTSPAFRRESLEKYGPPEDRPAAAFLRGVGEYSMDFMFGGNRGSAKIPQNVTAPSHIDFSVIDAALMQKFGAMKVAMMSSSEKQQAYEEMNNK